MDQYQHAVLRYDNLLLFGGDRRVLDGNAVPHAYSDMFSEIADAATQCGCTFTLYVDIGINTANAEEAANLAQLLSTMFNLEPRHGQKSGFGGAYFECMKAPFLGKNGHIAMRTPDLTAAMEELKEKGFTFNMDTAAYFEDGRIKNVYLNGEYGGFAIHIMQK